MLPIRLACLPSYRTHWTEWTEEVRGGALAAMSALREVEVVEPREGSTAHGAVHTLDEAEIAAGHFRERGAQGLVICPVDFGDERSACKVAELLNVPVLLFATREPPARSDASLARVSDSYCGTLSIAAGLKRRGIAFRFGGIHLPREAGLRAELEAFAGAVAVVGGLRQARIGQVGVRPSTFETVAYDEVSMARTFGQNVVHEELETIAAQARGIGADEARVRDIVAQVQSGVPTISVGGDYLVEAARIEISLADFWERNGLSAMAVQCWPVIQKSMGISLCAVLGRLTGRGMLTACEADVLGALSMLACHRASLGQAVPHFVDWTIQHREDPSLLLAWHCGNAPVCLARDPTEVALRSRRDMRGGEPAEPHDSMAGLFQFQLKPGPVTFCRLAEYDGAWTMLIASGRIEPSSETQAGTWAWVRVPDHERLYRTLAERGFIHHASMIHGELSGELSQACGFLGIQPVVVS